ncbi:MAG: ATP-binding protein [Phycisphaerales bacterium]|nr:ATP-binding protein [Phycisphaerales bacterium]
MPASFATFQRLKDKGLAALREGDHVAARPYLIQAAECMIEIAEANTDPAQRAEQEAYAKELLDLARDCDRRAAAGGRGGGAALRPRGERARGGGGGDEEPGANPDDWIVREKPTVRFDDIAGLDDVKAEIKLKMLHPFNHPELAARYGIDVGGGVLLWGPPGTGKTMFAKAIACELDATMFVISPAQLMSKWVGEAEQNVRKLFDAAKQEAKSIIFMDEVEALVPRRSGQQSTVMQRVVPQILQEIEGFDRKAGRALLFLGATNEPWSLDPAMMRPGRLDAKIYVPLPDAPARLRLFEIYLGKRPLADDIDLPALVELTAGYSGADIKAICERSARRPFLESIEGGQPRNIRQADLLAVLAETPRSVTGKELERFEKWRIENQ